MSTQAEALREKYRALQATGARDIKFCFGPLCEETEEDVFESVSTALDAITAGAYSELPPIGDARRLRRPLVKAA